ncbi:MAG: Anaphase-promoting complex subunit 4 domain [Deltaproteobacteria bacterium]|nr:Anaphase-promoting complex subunit 4 domain [Deltaproteobacteria bacterium]
MYASHRRFLYVPSVTRSLVLVLVLAACGAAHVAPTDSLRDVREGDVFGAETWRVPGLVEYIGFSGDDIVVATQGGAIARFGRDGTRHIVVEGALADVAGVAMQDDSLVMASDRIIRVDLRTGAASPVDLGHSAYALAVANGRAVVGEGREGPLRVIDIATGKVLTELEHSRGYVSPRIVGDWVLAGRDERAAGIWELATGKRHRAFAVGNATLYAMSPDRQLIATGNFFAASENAIDINRIDTGARTGTIRLSCSPDALAFAPASDRLAIACKDEIRIVKAPGGEQVAKLPGSRAHVRSLEWSPTGDLLALGGNDSILHVWRTDTWEPLTRVTGSRGEIREIKVTGRYLVAHSLAGNSAWLWVTDLVKPVIELGGVGREILTVEGDGNDVLVALMSSAGGEPRAVVERWRGVSRVAQAALPAARTGLPPLVRALGPIAGGGVWFTAEGRVTVLDADLRPRWTSPLTTDPKDPTAIGYGNAGATKNGAVIALHAGGKLSIVSGIERRLAASERYVGCGNTPPAVSPDGKRVALLDPKGIFVFDASTAKVIASRGVPTDDEDPRALAWSGDGELVALAGRLLVAWNVTANTAIVMPSAPSAITLAIDHDRIYFGRNDGTVARRSLSAMRRGAKPFPIATPAACEDEGGTMGLASFGRLGGSDAPRGRLDDAGAYDEPDPPIPGESGGTEAE